MDSSVIIAIIIVCLAIFIFVPISIASAKDRRKKQQAYKKIVDEICATNHLNLSSTEIINDQLLGLDTNKKLLVYSDLQEYPKDVTIVHLSEIQSGALIKNTERIETDGRNRTNPHIRISDIGIALYSHTKELLVECVFYDDIKNNIAEMVGLTKNAKDWLHRLNTVTPLKITENAI